MVKKTVKRIVILLLALSLSRAAAPVYAKEGQQAVTAEIVPGFEKVAQNESLELYLNKETLGIQVRDTANDVIYSSFADRSEGMNDVWKGFMDSGVTLEYMTSDMKLTRLPFAGSGAQAKITPMGQGVSIEVTYPEGFGVEIQVSLEGSRMTVRVMDDSIVEPKEGSYIQNLYLFPFLGATYGAEIPGYLFLPDGCGALIRTDVKSLANSGAYSKRVYGQEMGVGDFNVLTERAAPSAQIYMPVYGVIPEEGKYGIAAIIEDGDAYAVIEACVKGAELPVNYITSKFVYRETYTRSLNQNGDTMVTNQSQRNHMDIVEHYEFLANEEADYVGIAMAYQEYLVETGVLKENTVEKSEIPLLLEVLLSEQQPRMIGSKTIEMTTKDQAEEIVGILTEEGVRDMDVILYGYSPDGASASSPTRASFEKKVGSQSDWKAFAEKWKERGVELGYYTDFATANESVPGFKKRRDVAQNASERLLESFRYEPFYFLSPAYARDKFEAESKDYLKGGASLLAMDSVGYHLYSNWNSHNPTFREESMEIYKNLTIEGLNTAYYNANSYVWKNAAVLYDIPEDSSNYMLFTDTVPVMQMVLKGYVDYHSDKSNFHADRTKDTLRMIEYGEYPAWMVTYEDSINLIDTPSSWIYTSQFSIWKDQILAEYDLLSKALKPVRNAHMTDRKELKEGVVSVTYDNGITITVNYTDEAYQGSGVQVDALSFSTAKAR